jgi:hypothetical protein
LRSGRLDCCHRRRLPYAQEAILLAYYVYAVRREVLPDAVLRTYENKNES